MKRTQRIALVTGASSGIRRATAIRLSREGYRVVLVARSRSKLESTAQALDLEGHVVACDLADGEAAVAMAATVKEQVGLPDVIVNSAGSGAWKRIEETGPDDVAAMLSAPFFAAFHTSHAFMEDMLRRGSGVLIHVGSPASFAPWPSSVGYTASRAALRGMHEALRQDLHGSGVHSCHVLFGRVDSPYFDTNEHAADRIPGMSRIVRTISPDECAEVILRTIQRPRNEVLYPAMLRVAYRTYRILPSLMRWGLRRTGFHPSTSDQ